MKKRVIIWTLLFALLCSLLPSVAVWAEPKSSSVRYFVNGKMGTLFVFGEGEMDDYSSAEGAPWMENKSAITSVEIGSGITSIGSNAFQGLRIIGTLTIPQSVVSINADAFSGCEQLNRIVYGGSMQSWEQISVASGNEALSRAELVCRITDDTAGSTLYIDAIDAAQEKIQAAVSTGASYISQYGEGLLFDLDHDGSNELILIYDAPDDGSQDNGLRRMVCSVYSAAGGQLQALMYQQAVFAEVGGISGEVSVVQHEGKEYLRLVESVPEEVFEDDTIRYLSKTTVRIYELDGDSLEPRHTAVAECYWTTADIDYEKSSCTIDGERDRYEVFEAWNDQYQLLLAADGRSNEFGRISDDGFDLPTLKRLCTQEASQSAGQTAPPGFEGDKKIYVDYLLNGGYDTLFEYSDPDRTLIESAMADFDGDGTFELFLTFCDQTESNFGGPPVFYRLFTIRDGSVEALTGAEYTGGRWMWQRMDCGVIAGSGRNVILISDINRGGVEYISTTTTAYELKNGALEEALVLYDAEINENTRDESAQSEMARVRGSTDLYTVQNGAFSYCMIDGEYVSRDEFKARIGASEDPNFKLKDGTFYDPIPYGYTAWDRASDEEQPAGPAAPFNEDLYRAERLLDSASLDVQTFGALREIDSPCKFMSDLLMENGFSDTAKAWKQLTTAWDSVSSPFKTVDKLAFQETDMFVAMLMQGMQRSTQIGYADVCAGITKDAAVISSKLTDLVKARYQYDVLTSKEFQSFTSEQKEYMKQYFLSGMIEEVKEPELISLNKVLDQWDLLFSAADSMESFVEQVLTCYQLFHTVDSEKLLLQAMYDNSVRNGHRTSLQNALSECLRIMENSDSIIRQMCLIQESAYLIGGRFALKEGMSRYWDKQKLALAAELPEAALVLAAYEGGKFVSNLLFSSDALVESYYKMLATLEMETLADETTADLKDRFQKEHSEENAAALLRSCDLCYGLFYIDCDDACAYCDTVDNALAKKIWRKWNQSNYAEVIKNITEIKNSAGLQQYMFSVVWIGGLREDYPELYEIYKDRLNYQNELSSGYSREYSFHCPVNVMIYDQDDALVASIEENRVYASGNVTVTLYGDQKLVRFYDDAQYRIECEGYDTGTMDIQINEYDRDGRNIRSVGFYDLATSKKSKHVTRTKETLSDTTPYYFENLAATIQANYDSKLNAQQLKVDVESGYITYMEETATSLSVAPNALVDLTAYVPSGYVFDRWSAAPGSVEFENERSIQTSAKITGSCEVTALLSKAVEETADTAAEPEPDDVTKPLIPRFAWIALLVLIGLVGLIVIPILLSGKKDRTESGRAIEARPAQPKGQKGTNRISNKNPMISGPLPATRTVQNSAYYGRITVLNGEAMSKRAEMSDGQTIMIGKDPEKCDFVLPPSYSTVSRCHCRVSFDAGSCVFSVEDLSKNGTMLLDGNRLPAGGARLIPSGVTLCLGNAYCRILLEVIKKT